MKHESRFLRAIGALAGHCTGSHDALAVTKTRAYACILFIHMMLFGAFSVLAGPTLPVTKPPVQPFNYTGPAIDPQALQGQWFQYPDGIEVVCTNEFYDNTVNSGGGFVGTDALFGYVDKVLFDAAGNITNFCIQATIFNDTGTTIDPWADGFNSHDESLQYREEQVPVIMTHTRLTAEFAILDPNSLPAQFQYPYRDAVPRIEAINEDLAAWYCWGSEDQNPDPPHPGNYYVPSWDFGTINPGQSATRQLCFAIPGGLPSGDPRFDAIMESNMDGTDILLNRTSSLKISTWIDDVALDTGVNYPEWPLRGSDASVFHNIGEEVEPDPDPESWKWRQPPDLSVLGFDVECMKDRPILLADDFLCTTNTSITNIVIWGSWLYDELPFEPGEAGNPSNVFFTLSFHADIPAGVAADWSMPGEPLWTETFGPGTFEARIEAANIVEGWYDPATTNYQSNADWTCWRYTFPVDATRVFVQTGTVDNPIVYWLAVQADPIQGEPVSRFGWKTTPPEHQWNDDACWAPAVDPYNGFWWDMHYPPGHPLHDPQLPHSFDLAFMLFGGPVPEEVEYDFGDAPDQSVAGSPWNYPTRRIDNGARHRIDPTGPWLGDSTDFPDPEPDGQPHLQALGDDNDGNDDENGVLFPQLIMGQPAQIQVTVSDGSGGTSPNPGGYVDAWIDWNGDGVWQHPAERIFSGFLPIGINNIAIVPPSGSTNGWTFARFRISRQGGLSPTGAADDGEVEDHMVFIDHADWGDAPEPPYPTTQAQNGAWHVIVPGLLLGAHIDAEPDGQPTPGADGDDNNPAAGPNDEDGIQMVSGLYPGMDVSVIVTAVGTGLLSAWLDINSVNGWDDPGEQVLTDVSLFTGVHHLTFRVPDNAVPGNSYMRWRYSTQTGLTVRGGAPDGEIEDHEALIRTIEEAEFDFGDAPTNYPTLLADDGARHVVIAGDLNILGSLIDAEPDGQPTDLADGDDLNNLADEDGVIFPTNSLGQAVLVQGSNMTIKVITPGSPWLSAWIDFEGNSSWGDPGNMIASGLQLSPGTNLLTVTAPVNTFLGRTYARFRTSSLNMPLAYTGAVPDGEVEDYHLYITQPVPSGGSDINITNLVFDASSGATLQWLCDPALLTLPQVCSNLVEASTNPAAWLDLRRVTADRYHLDPAATNTPVRFYRVRAPFLYP